MTSTAVPTASTGSDAPLRPTNTAFVLLRPDLLRGTDATAAEAEADPVVAHFRAVCDRHRVRRERCGLIATEAIASGSLYDAHFSEAEQFATRVLPSRLRLSFEQREAFAAHFKSTGNTAAANEGSSTSPASSTPLTWADAASKGEVLNAAEYMRRVEERLHQRRTAAKEAATRRRQEARAAGATEAELEAAAEAEAKGLNGVAPPSMGDVTGENDAARARLILARLCSAANSTAAADAATTPNRLVLSDVLTIHRIVSPDAVSLDDTDGDSAAGKPSAAEEEEATVFVVNGELPYSRALFTYKPQVGDADEQHQKRKKNTYAMWFTVSWRSEDLSWADFNAKVIGSFAPSSPNDDNNNSITNNGDEQCAEAAAEAAEQRLSVPFCAALQRYGESFFGLDRDTVRGAHLVPSLAASNAAEADGGASGYINASGSAVVYSSGPLESFFALQTWLAVPPAKTLFGLYAAQRGIPLTLLAPLAANLQIHSRATTGPALSMTRGIDTDAALAILAQHAAEEAALPVLNTALVFVKPHANNSATRALVEQMLSDKEIRIIVQGRRSAETIKEQHIITRHYSVIAENALNVVGSALASAPAVGRSGAEAFEKAFGVPLADACAEGRVLSAAEAMAPGGLLASGKPLTPERLALTWRLCDKVTKLAPGLYIGRSKCEDEPPALTTAPEGNGEEPPKQPASYTYKYIINGFFPLIMEKFTTEGASVQWYLVSWPEDRLSWADFRGKVIGPTDPSKAPEGSIRAAILSDWRGLGLLERPDGSDNGVHASAGPLEALAERLIWINSASSSSSSSAASSGGNGIESDVLTTVAAERGVSSHYSLRSWVSNATLTNGDKIILPTTGAPIGNGPIFDLTEDMQTSVFIEVLRQAEAAESAARRRNHALMFIKPHAVTDAVASVVETILSCHDITVTRTGETDAETIAARNLVDRHYSVIAQNAMTTAESLLRSRYITIPAVPSTKTVVGPDGTKSEVPLTEEDVAAAEAAMEAEQRQLEEAAAATTAMALLPPLPEAGQRAFEAAFGLSWGDAVRCHSVLTAQEAVELLDLSSMQLTKKWKSKELCPTTVRVAPGMYVGHFVREGLFVINGFYPLNREKFTTPGRKIRWLAVSWAEDRLSWADFRGKVIGPTDPSKAPEGSIRAVIYKEWERLGLPQCPDTSDNGVHASAGALEGLAERIIWLSNAAPAASNSGSGSGSGSASANAKGAELMADVIARDPFGMALLNPPTAPLSGETDANDGQMADDVSSPLPTSFIEYCLTNPTFADTNKPLFDATEDKQSSECAAALRRLYSAAAAEFRRNRCVVLVRPTTASPSALTAIEAIFADNAITVDKKESVLSRDFADRVRLVEPPQLPAEAVILSAAAREKFYIQFGEQWDDAVSQGRVHTADAAAERLASAFALLTPEEQYKVSEATFDVAARWRQSGTDNNILYVSTENALVAAAAACGGNPTPSAGTSASFLPPTLEVGFDPAHDWYVMNGSLCNVAFSRRDGLACRYELSWDAFGAASSSPSESDVKSVDAASAAREQPLPRSYAAVLGAVIGAADATCAPEDSVRGAIYRRWHQLGLGAAVAANDTGVRCSAGPLNALLDRCMWAALEAAAARDLAGPSSPSSSTSAHPNGADDGVPPPPTHPTFRANLSRELRADPFGRELLNHGLSADVIQYVLFCNPAVAIGSGGGSSSSSTSSSTAAPRREGPILDLLAHLDTRLVVPALLSVKGTLERMWDVELTEVRAEEARQRSPNSDGGSTTSPLSVSRAASRSLRQAHGAVALRKGRIGGGVPGRKNGPRNEALVFIKPHAAGSAAVTALVEAKLQEHFIRVDSEGEIPCEVIGERRLVDAHYAAIASYALRADAEEIGASTLTDATRAKFEAVFGTSWAAATAAKRIMNAAAALDTFGLSAKDLSDRFGAAKVSLKIAPGLYAALLPDLTISGNGAIVINGFYPLNREKFTTPGRKIRWLAVSWAEDRLSWADFRGKVIGPTDPSKAPEGSIRATILKDWDKLGLQSMPNVSDNGVHASAGPLEGVAERIIWTGATLRQLGFSRCLLTQRGVTERFLKRCLANPSMEVDIDPIMAKKKTIASAATDGNQQLSTVLVKGRTESIVTEPASAAAAAQAASLRFGPIFDLLEDVQSSKALNILQRLFETDRANNMQNTALLFVKPHALTPLAVAYIEACIRENRLEVVSQGTVTRGAVARRGLIDMHYSTISAFAGRWENDAERQRRAETCEDEAVLASLEQPNSLFDTIRQEAGSAAAYAKKLAEFEKTFGMPLERALRAGLVMGAEAAVRHISAIEAESNAARNRVPMKKYDDRHREVTPAIDLFNRWDAAANFMKLASGVYAKLITVAAPTASSSSSASPSSAPALALPTAEDSTGIAIMSDDPKAIVQLPLADMHTFVVINGFYPKLRESYTSPSSSSSAPPSDASNTATTVGNPSNASASAAAAEDARPAVQWYVLSWPEATLSWADFRAKFVGPTNPLSAPSGSLRGGLYTNWRDLGMAAKPDTTDNGVHASAGPLEGLVERLIWTTPAQSVSADGTVTENKIDLSNPDSVSPHLFRDAMASALMDHALSADDIARLCGNPTLTAAGATLPVFVHTEDMQSSALAPFLLTALREEAAAARRAAEEAKAEAERMAELQLLAAAAEAEDSAARAVPTNTAFVFIKPHAVTDGVKALAEATFLEKGMTIVRQGVFTHNQAARVIDQHYNTASAYAMLKPPHHLSLSDEAKTAFASLTDGRVGWEQAVSVGHVQNAAGAMRELGDLTPAMLARRWEEESTKKVKVAPGVYVGYLESDDMFVVNGFYPRIRDKFTAEGSSVHYYVVEWPEEALSWADFRGKVVGPTDPTKAPEGSLRGTILRDWRQLGLERAPSMADNGIHASAGPLEGLVERCVWLRQLPQLDAFGVEVVTKRGVPLDYFNRWVRNEFVAVSSSLRGLAFDLTEDLQSTVVANMIADAREYSESSAVASPQRKVAIAPKRGLFEASLRDYFINLNNMSTVADFERLFQYYDREGRGSISREEFFVDYNRFECYGHPMDAGLVEELFTKYDYTRDGRMSFDEFCILMLARVAHM